MSEQLKAADALLDLGISIPMKPLKFRKWKFTPRVTMKRPPLGGRIRILRLWLQLDVTVADIEKMNETEQLKFIVDNARTITKMVALMILNRYVSGRLLAPVMAWILRWRVHEDVLLHATLEFMSLQNVQGFLTVIRSAENSNLLSPNLSRAKKRS